MRWSLLCSLLLCAACGQSGFANRSAAANEAEAQSRSGEATESAADAHEGDALAGEAAEKLVGTKAPDMTLQTINGQRLRLDDFYGRKAVYLKFWATWCVPCRLQMPHFEHVAQTAGDDLEVIGVNTGFNDNLQLVEQYRREHGLTMPLTIDDGRLARAFDLRVTPQHIVIGKDGRIALVGHLADRRLDQAIERARRGEPTPSQSAASSTRPIDSSLALAKPLLAIDGRGVTIRPTARKETVLLFFSPWCEPYFEKSRPEASRACRTAREASAAEGPGGRRKWIAIASRLWVTRADVASYAKDKHVRIPIVVDETGELFRAFDVNRVPTFIVISSSGRVLRRIEGSDKDFAAELRSLEKKA
jgi:peroxiredoxin